MKRYEITVIRATTYAVEADSDEHAFDVLADGLGHEEWDETLSMEITRIDDV